MLQWAVQGHEVGLHAGRVVAGLEWRCAFTGLLQPLVKTLLENLGQGGQAWGSGPFPQQQLAGSGVGHADGAVGFRHQDAGVHALDDLVVELFQLLDAARPLGGQLFTGGQAPGYVLEQEGGREVDEPHDPCPHDVIHTGKPLKQEQGGCNQRGQGCHCGVQDAEPTGNQDVAGGHADDAQVHDAAADATAEEGEQVDRYYVRQNGDGDVPGAERIAGQQQHARDDVHRQVGERRGLEQPFVVQSGADQVCLKQQQRHQQQTDDDPVVVVDAEKTGPLVLPCCRWRRLHGDSVWVERQNGFRWL